MYQARLVEKYLPEALNALEEIEQTQTVFHTDNNSGKREIKDTYVAYAAAFGPIMLQMGIVPAMATYLSETGNSEGDRSVIIGLLARMMGKENSRDLFAAFRNNPSDKARCCELESAVVALKLAMRTYPIARKGGRR